MKKLFFFCSFITFSAFAIAQTTTETKLVNKKGLSIHPEVGDWAIGVDATPFLNYAGNMFKIASANNVAPSFGFTAQNPGSLVGKYVAAENKFYRFGLTIGISANSEDVLNIRDDENPNQFTTSALAIGISAGIEHRRAFKNRLVGYFGYEAGVMQTPYNGTSRNSGEVITGKATYTDNEISSNSYVEKGGNTISISANGFVGVEYFFAPKIAISGEFGFGLKAYRKGDRKYEPETGTKEIIDAKKQGFSLSPKSSGDLVLLFYF